MTVILDASAMLAVVLNEPGGQKVQAMLSEAAISTVNLSEVYAKAMENGLDVIGVRSAIMALPIRIIAFGEPQAFLAGELRRQTRGLGLSLGDRACLATAVIEKCPVITADRAWLQLDLGVQIITIR